MRRLLIAMLAAACLFGAAPRPADAADDEAAVVAGVNSIRTSRGLRPLEVHPEIQLKARAWAAHIAGIGALTHSQLDEGITVGWISLAENVAMGGTVDQAEQALLTSPVHIANVVDPEKSHIGVGLASAGDYVYLVQVFMELPTPAAAPPTTATAPAPTITAPGVLAVPPPAPKPLAAVPVSLPDTAGAPAPAAPAPVVYAAPVVAAARPPTAPAASAPAAPTAPAPPSVRSPSFTAVTHSRPVKAPSPTETSAVGRILWLPGLGLLLLFIGVHRVAR